jgi:V8-like Glu-specific endopeptidase
VPTTYITGPYVLGAGQNLTFGDENPGLGAYVGNSSSFTDLGTLTLSSSNANINVSAMGEIASVTIGAGGSATVSGAGSVASGYGLASQTGSFENDGVFHVTNTGVGGGENWAFGVEGSTDTLTFVNTSDFSVSADTAWGVDSYNLASFNNSGDMVITGVHQAIGVEVESPGSTGVIRNSGTITVTASANTYGIVADSQYDTPLQIINTGTITADTAIATFVMSSPASTRTVDLTNSGTINGDIDLGVGPAVSAFNPVGSLAGSQIVNTGRINGAIHLDTNGNDFYDGRGGTLTGGIYLGAGTDTVYLGNDNETVHGGTGSSLIVAGAGADTILGGTADDTIVAGAGADILTGGLGSDEFVFHPGFGTAEVTDFTQAQADQIDLSWFSTFHTLADVLAATTYSNGNATIHAGSGTITLDNVNPANFTASDFALSPVRLLSPIDVYVIGASTSLSLTNEFANDIAASGGEVVNNGSISMIGVSYAMVMTNDIGTNATAQFVNNGSISISGTSGDVFTNTNLQNTGVVAAAFTLNGDITNGAFTNSGHITVSGGSYDVLVADTTQSAPALIQNLATGVLTVSATNAEADAAKLEHSGEFDNAGTISVTAAPTWDAYGVQIDQAQLGGVSTAYALFNNSGNLTMIGAGGIGFEMRADAGGVQPGAGQYNVINSGTIAASLEAISFVGSSTTYNGVVAHIDNSGTINGGISLLSSLNNVLLNTGTINGAIALGDGNDVIDSSAGAINGEILLGAGVNTVSLGSGNATLLLGAGGGSFQGDGGADTLSAANAAYGVSISLAMQGQLQSTGGAGSITFSNFQNLTGSTHDDTLEGNSGNNVLDGGGGTNTVSYAHASSGVTVSLAIQGSPQNTIGAGIDTLSNFQNLTGSAFNDTLEGSSGNNVLDGGAGINTVSYGHASSGVTVSLALQGSAQNTGGAGTDTLFHFQALIGSAYNDTLEGGGAASTTLTGGLGADTFVYRPGDQSVTVTDFSHAQGDKVDLTAFSQFNSLASVLAAVTQSGADTVINTGSGLLTLKNVSEASLVASDFKLTAPTLPYPYDAVCLITDTIGSEQLQGSGVIIGPHTILTAAHVVWNGGTDQAATNINIEPGYNGGTTSILGAATHFNSIVDPNDLITPAQSQNDFAIIDVTQDLSKYDYFQVLPNYAGGTANISGYPATNDGGQLDTTGTVTQDSIYSLLDYSSALGVSPGSSGGPIWVNEGTTANPIPAVAGIVSTGSWGAQLTSADWAKIQGWIAQDAPLWGETAMIGSAANNFTATLAGSSQQYTIGAGGTTVTGGPQYANDILANVQRIQFADGYETYSTTDPAAEVYRLYEATLNRGPDPEGLASWVSTLNSGTSLQTVANGFVSSTEFQADYGQLSNTNFINLLYENVLHRGSDPTGLSFWLGQMSGGATQAQVVLGFSESTENINDSATALSQGLWVGNTNAAEVARLYDTTLQRLPDLTGLTFWTNQLQTGASLQSVVNGFTSSTEFQNTYGALSNSDFVTLLYNNTLHRAPDQTGLTFWVGQLTSGAETRAQVVLGFSDSTEHIADTAPHIDGGIWVI